MTTSETRLRAFAHSEPDHCLAVCGNVVLTFSLQPPNPRFLTAWAEAVDQLVARSSGPIAVVIIIDSNARSPDDDSKAAIRQTVVRHGAHIQGLAYVIEGHGFAAAAVRSAVSIIGLAARYPFPQKVFKTDVDAVQWTLRQLPSDAARERELRSILATIEAMRDEVKRLFAAAG